MYTLIALPAYNEGKVIASVIEKIQKAGYEHILVVDDGSKDNTSEVARNAKAHVVTHPINRGAGAATATAIAYAKANGVDRLVLLDADGQHDPHDIKRLDQAANKYDVIIGSRNAFDKNMPIIRKFLNITGSLITWAFFGLFVYDSQSGFKIFNKQAIQKIQITYDRFEFCSEIIGQIHKHKLSCKEVPISVIYTNHSKAKGQSFKNGIKMLIRFLLH
jgi:glycosyltransferase involved in cell wall biosynthesis